MTKLIASSVIANKFWIIQENNDKIGTLTKVADNSYSYHTNINNETIIVGQEFVDDTFEFIQKASSIQFQKQLLGYPVPEIELFKTGSRNTLPVFAKSQVSKIYYAAGYYAIEYPLNGWTDAFCPKVSTLKKYEWAGPFKTEADMNLTIARFCRK